MFERVCYDNKRLFENHQNEFRPFLLTKAIEVEVICFGSYTPFEHQYVNRLQTVIFDSSKEYFQTELAIRTHQTFEKSQQCFITNILLR